MARSRTLKPGFFKNEQLAECDFAARLLFAGLWTLADREGRLEYRPKRIKAELFPFDEVSVESCIQALELRGLIRLYHHAGADLIWIPTFVIHQRPHPHEAESTYGEYSGSAELPAVTSNCSPCNDTSSCAFPSLNPLILQSLNPTTAEPENLASPVLMVFPCSGVGPKEFKLTQSKLDEYAASFPGLDALAQCRAARQWCIDNPRNRKSHTGMPRFLANWLTKNQNQARQGSVAPDSSEAERRAVLAWEACWKRRKLFESPFQFVFDDPVITQTVNNIGVKRLADKGEDSKWLRKDFERIYQLIADSGASEQVPIVGLEFLQVPVDKRDKSVHVAKTGLAWVKPELLKGDE